MQICAIHKHTHKLNGRQKIPVTVLHRKYAGGSVHVSFSSPVTASVLICIDAVSYTHLDVYKRQSQICMTVNF